MRTAIVGSGISGLTSAYLLSEEHELAVYEAEDRIGGHTHTVDVALSGRSSRSTPAPSCSTGTPNRASPR